MRKLNPAFAATRATAVIIATLCLAACGGSGGGGGDSEVTVTGTARSVLNDSVQASRDFVVQDLGQPADAAPVASGTSDSNGVYTFQYKGGVTAIIVFPPVVGALSDPRSSGLFSVAAGDVSNRILKDETDLACIAGVTAVRATPTGLDPALLTATRIANLEAAARIVIDAGGVDFTDADSVSAGAAQVRQMTNDGANPPASP